METPKMYWNAFVKGVEDHFSWTAQDTAVLVVICLAIIVLVFALYKRWRK